jgi:hypothetical protein
VGDDAVIVATLQLLTMVRVKEAVAMTVDEPAVAVPVTTMV